MKQKEPAKLRGRPRAFDVDTALDKAMHVFWKSGYEGASLPDLTEAMGINRPSLYAAFGNKEELFRKALNRYLQQATGPMSEALNLPTAKEGVERMMRNAIANSGCGNSKGCLLINGALACSESSESIRQELVLQRKAAEMALRQRFERASVEKELPSHIDPAAMAKYVATFQHGLAVQIASGATWKELSSAVDLMMAGWPY